MRKFIQIKNCFEGLNFKWEDIMISIQFSETFKI